MERAKIKILIADDSALMRREIKSIIESDPSLTVIGAAKNGQEAVDMAKALDPDVVSLDINMPVMDGLTALQFIMVECPRPVVMMSSLTQEGALTTYEALELGAVDFIPKPGGTVSLNIREQAQLITETLKAAAQSRPKGRVSRRAKPEKPQRDASQAIEPTRAGPVPGLIVIGQSTGGPNTILEILPHLPADLDLPVFVIQHMPGSFTPSFAQRLNDHSAFPFRHVKNGEPLLPGHGYLAPGDIHCKIVRRAGDPSQLAFQLSRFPTDTLHTPSVDVSMASALEIFGSRLIGVILTGMGSDGADALAQIRAVGGRTIAESEETAIVFGMPKEAIRRGGAEFILPVPKIAGKIIELAAGLAPSSTQKGIRRTS